MSLDPARIMEVYCTSCRTWTTMCRLGACARTGTLPVVPA